MSTIEFQNLVKQYKDVTAVNDLSAKALPGRITGFLGPNGAGKSTLISRISAARPKIADYPFTTLTPNLGVVTLDPDRSFVVANFLQNELTGDPEGAVGHVAPVAAFDAKAGRVLVLDTDRDYYEPYWVSEAAFIRSMNTVDKASGKTRGLLWIHR